MKPRFISDIHLSENNSHLTNAFKRFLNESKENLEHLNISCTKGNILNVLKAVTNKLPNLKIFIASNMKKVENIL